MRRAAAAPRGGLLLSTFRLVGALPRRLRRTAAPCALGAGVARAQQPPLPVTATRADSLAGLARLDSLAARPDAAAATWHARGVLAWQLSQGKRAVGTKVDREQLRLNQAADSSLVQAVTRERTNVRFLVDFATYRSQGSPMVRAGATRHIKRAFDAARAPAPVVQIWMFADGADAVARDSARTSPEGLAARKLRAPRGDLYARAEVMVEGGGAARGTTFAPSVAAGNGLVVSDIVVAAAATAGAAPARRWHELAILPAPDTLRRARGIALAWEVYNLPAKDGAQHYSVRLVLEKASKSVAGRIVAQIGGLVGVQRGNDHVALTYERDAAARDVIVEHATLSLREAPAGRYTLSIEITDRVTGTRASRSTPLLIAP